MKIIAMEVGYIATNCYIVVNEETHHGVIIDPGGDAGRIMEAVQKENLTVDAIFLTATVTILWRWQKLRKKPARRCISVRKMLRC